MIIDQTLLSKTKMLPNPFVIPSKAGKDITIFHEDLPENPDEICNILRDEKTIMMYYIPIALHYNKNRGMPQAAIRVLERGLKEAKGTSEDNMKINNLIACLNLRMAKYPQDGRFPSDERKSELLNEATKRFNKASQIRYLHLLRNDPNMAMNAFTNATNLASNNIPALFGQDYRAALKIYQQIMQADPSLTEPDPRVGIGLCYNKLNNFDQAIAAFDRAIELNPNNVSANILLATMELDISKQWQQINEEERLTNFAAAMRRANRALELNPNHSSALILLAHGFYFQRDFEKILAILNAISALDETDSVKREKIFEEFDRITKAISEKDYDNPDIFIVKGISTEGKNAYKSLQSLKKAQKMYEEAKEPVPLELCNKMGNLCFKLGDYENAITYYQNSIDTSKSHIDSERDVEITLRYNLARALEASHNYVDAQNIYNEIITEHPSYTPAHLRLAAIEESHNNYEKANEIYNELLELDEKDLEVRKRRAINILRHGETRTSRKYLEAILNEYDKNDAVALTALGSLFLSKARSIRQENMREQREANYKKAVEYFQKALKTNARNLWAANGITVALAESGRLREAKDMFWKLRERNPIPEININYAHVCCHLNDYPSAILAYESVSKKCHNKDVQVLEWLGRSNYVLAKAKKDIDMMEEALQWTEKASLIQQGMAQMISELDSSLSSSVITRAIEDVKSANAFGLSVITSLEGKYQKAKEVEEARQKRLEEEQRIKEEKERQLNIQKEEEQRRKREELDKAAERDRIRRQELLEYDERQKLLWGEENKKRKNRQMNIDDDDYDDDEAIHMSK
ncbi:9458_t:CDS:10, partial [Acaulospora colombiana]